jgi:hypothetical protein
MKRKLIQLFLITIVMYGCKKEPVTITSIVSSDKYYQSEVFNNNYIQIYGKWQYKTASYGWSGPQAPEFEYLEFTKYGIYAKINDNEIIEYGKLDIISQDIAYLNASFISEKKIKNPWMNYFININNDTMFINNGYMDGLIMMFIRNR